LQPQVEDVDMNFDANHLAMDDLAQEQAKLKSSEELKEELSGYIDQKYQQLYEKTQQMLNAFHIDIIRQFEIQKSHLDSIVHDYMLQDAADDADHAPDDKFIIEVVVNRDWAAGVDGEDIDDYLQ
jgi:hypothetical protein